MIIRPTCRFVGSINRNRVELWSQPVSIWHFASVTIQVPVFLSLLQNWQALKKTALPARNDNNDTKSNLLPVSHNNWLLSCKLNTSSWTIVHPSSVSWTIASDNLHLNKTEKCHFTHNVAYMLLLQKTAHLHEYCARPCARHVVLWLRTFAPLEVARRPFKNYLEYFGVWGFQFL